MADSNRIEALRSICESCPSYGEAREFKGQKFEAKRFDRILTEESKYGIMGVSQMISGNLLRIVDGAIDGKEWQTSSWDGGTVRGRGNGGGDKTMCFFDPQEWTRKITRKTQQTELMYIHHKYCMRQFIAADGVHGVYFDDRSGLGQISRATGLATKFLMLDMQKFALALDMNIVLGNFALDVAEDQKGNAIASAGALFDGILKQVVQNETGTYYPAVKSAEPLPTLAAGQEFALKYQGQFIDIYADATELTQAINDLCLDINGEKLFTAILDGQDLIITGSNPTKLVYGDNYLEVYVFEGSLSNCDKFLPFTVLQNAMQMEYVEEACFFPYKALNKTNIYDEFLEVIQQFRAKLIALSATGMVSDVASMSDMYIGMPPEMYDLMDFARINKMCGCENAIEQTAAIERLMPRFVPLKVLASTGIWFMTTPENIVFLTNQAEGMETEIWYEQKCNEINTRMEMVGNVLVMDHNLFATNAKGSPWAQKLHSPYMPKNLPHMCEEVRQGCCTGGSASTGSALTIEAKSTAIAVDDNTLSLTSSVVVPDGDSVASYEWNVYFGNTAQPPAAQAADVDIVTLTDAQVQSITMIGLSVTLASGIVIGETYLPSTKIEFC